MSVEEKDARKVMYCAMSLYNIANDLKEINPMVSNICLSMSKNLIAEMKKLEIPDAILHTEGMPHNTNVGTEIEELIKEIQAAEIDV